MICTLCRTDFPKEFTNPDGSCMACRAELVRKDSETMRPIPRAPHRVPLKEAPARTLERFIRQRAEQPDEDFEMVEFSDEPLWKYLA